MRRNDYNDKTVIEFGRDTSAGTLTKEESKALRDDMQHYHADPACTVEIELRTSDHELTGVCQSWGLNYPTFLFEDGRRGFICPEEEADDMRFLFKSTYIDGAGRPRYKFPIEEAKVTVYWYRTPKCPVCGDDMTHGMVSWDPCERHGGHMSGWLCEAHIPATVEEGIW